MRFELRQFRAEDALGLLDSPNEKGLRQVNRKDALKWARLNESEGPGFTAVYDGKIAACAGIRIYWPGVGEAWALYSEDIGYYHIDPKIARDMIYNLMTEYKLRRVQTTPRADWDKGIKYVEWLGFKREGLMRGYYPDGTDCYMYAIVRSN